MRPQRLKWLDGLILIFSYIGKFKDNSQDMKVFLLAKEPFPNGMAAVKRIIAYCKAWQREKIDVEVIIYTRTERYGVEPKNTEGIGTFEGIPFRYIKGSPLRESNVFLRQWNDWMDFYRLKRYLAKELSEGDIVFSYGFKIKSLKLIALVHSKGARFFNELCELPFGTGKETAKTIKNRKMYEKKIMPLFDGVITISDALTTYARQHCSAEARITRVPILVEYDKYDLEDRSDEAPIPYIFHCGTLYEQKDGFVSMLRTFGRIARELPFDVRFISAGSLSGTRHEAEIINIIDEYDLRDKVVFTGYLGYDEIKEYLSKASFVVINKFPNQQNKYGFSTKLGEYMAAGKAILISDFGEAMNWLVHGESAYIVPVNDMDALGEGMIKLFLDGDLRKKLGVGAKKTCKDFFTIEANSLKLKYSFDKK